MLLSVVIYLSCNSKILLFGFERETQGLSIVKVIFEEQYHKNNLAGTVAVFFIAKCIVN